MAYRRENQCAREILNENMEWVLQGKIITEIINEGD